MKIRDMQTSDIKRVLEIYNQALIEGKSTFNTDCPTKEEWDKSFLENARIVMCEEDTVIGWAALSKTSSRDCYKGVCSISVYISSEKREKGVGTALIKNIIQKAENIGIYSVYAAIFSSNIGSVKLFEKSGFRLVGTREKIAKDRFSNWQDTTIFEYRSKAIGID